jgi:murein DD-endopeptidase MepM/ murein hydrolase activator NlpD
MVIAVDFGSEHIDVPADRLPLLEPEIVEEEAAHVGEVFSRVAMQRLWEDTFIWPLAGQVTSPFGMSRTYNSGQQSYHGGVDISGDPGAPVVASNHGIVALAEPLDVRGGAVVLDHGWGVYSGYYHLSEILVNEGQKVAKGELIGRVGSTGLATGAHLHWEMRVGGILVNPLEWTARRIPE